MANDRLSARYSGKNASLYDQARASTDRSKTEEREFSDLFLACNPRTVLDCPIGTGRWIPYYKHAERITGIDISSDMLKQAQIKACQLGAANVQLLEGSVFDSEFLSQLDKSDLAVCTRFLNWFHTDQALMALRQLSSLAQRHLIIGVTVFVNDLSIKRYLLAHMTMFWLQLKQQARRKPLIYVHDENRILNFLNMLGWQEVERRRIFSKTFRINYFILLENGHLKNTHSSSA